MKHPARHVAFLTGVLTLAPVAASADLNCTIDHARYVLRGAPEYSVGFHVIGDYDTLVSNLALFVHSGKSDRTFWFFFDQGSARYIYLHSTTDVLAPDWRPPDPDGGDRPLGQMHYIPASADLSFSLVLPQSGQPAPSYILLPDLPDVMWYRVREPRESVPLAFFQLSDCES
jgi:hypothetical protein